MKYITKKDLSTVGYYLGILMIGVGISNFIPLIVSIIYGEGYSYGNFYGECYLSYIAPGFLSICIGFLLRKLKPIHNISLKHGMMISSLIWLWASFIGACTMVLFLKDFLFINFSFVDGFFESMSAWTTTGFTMFSNFETTHYPYSILFLRCFQQWIGGLGIVTLLTGLFLKSGKTISELYKSEARNEKIDPSMGNTLKKMIELYIFLTIIGIVLFIIARMSIFDSICNTFTALSTGGMPIHDNSMGYYNNNWFNLISIFIMIVGGISFVTTYRSVESKGFSFLRDIQFKVMIFLILIFSIVIYFTTKIFYVDVIYDVVSAITTTGTSLTAAISAFPPTAKILLILLMIIGCAAGSTGGGLKIIRVIIIFKGLYANIIRVLSPNDRVIKLKISNKEINDLEINEANSYFSVYMLMLLIGWLVLIFYNYDPINSLFDIASAQSNVGLSTIITHDMSDIVKIMLTINMWVGRLEIIPIFVLIRTIFEVFRMKTHNSEN
jgi:trk system potassium uptake protein TrkH